ncbi:TPA: DUF6602 domain-containing protein [Aeromonas hydrophila]
MSILSAKIEEKIRSIKSEYQINKKVLHQGLKGAFNESELSSLIKDVIPSRYKVTKGFIENHNNEQSNETDIIIYDDEILPPYIKNDLSVIPVEAVKYAFEVKSTLDATELKTTIGKFSRLREIGVTAPTVLFAFSSDVKGSELARYKKNENEFYTNPKISVLCVSGKAYYYKTVKELYLKDFISKTDWLKMMSSAINLDPIKALDDILDLSSKDEFLNGLTRSQFALIIKSSVQATNHRNGLSEKNLIFNGVSFSDIKFKVHKWIGIAGPSLELSNDVELSLLSGISNTLSKGDFGNYLLNEKDLEIKEFSICYEDMWGNLSSVDFDEDGLGYATGEISFSYSSSGTENGNKHEMIFHINKTNHCD